MPDSPPTSLTVAEFQKLIHHRYFQTDAARGTPGTFMWFIEEVGELATALHHHAARPGPDTARQLADEFADVFAWLCTLANISGIDLADALRKYTEPDRVRGVKD